MGTRQSVERRVRLGVYGRPARLEGAINSKFTLWCVYRFVIRVVWLTPNVKLSNPESLYISMMLLRARIEFQSWGDGKSWGHQTSLVNLQSSGQPETSRLRKLAITRKPVQLVVWGLGSTGTERSRGQGTRPFGNVETHWS